MRHRAAWLLSVVLLGCASPGGTPDPEPGHVPPHAPPNILFLFADDLRRDALSAFGSERAHTPNLDALAARGFVLDRAYCMGSRHGAVCIPSRAMLLSGRSLHRVRDDLQDAETLPEVLRQAGYRTFMTGKWHNGEESLKRCFPDARAAFLGGMCDHFAVPLCDVVQGQLQDRRTGEGHSSALFADATIAFLEQHARSTDGRPFFAYTAFTAPHDPRDAPVAYLDRFRRDPPPLPANFRPQHGLNLGPATMTVRDEDLAAWPRDPDVVRQQLAEYYGLVAHLDAELGRVLECLERTGQGQNTLVVFAADHGLALGSHGLLGKQSLYEHSMGAPVVLAGPGIPAGRRSDALVYLFDLCATLCDAAGAVRPQGSEGESLWPVLRDPGAFPPRTVLYTAYAGSQRAVRDRRWKLLHLPRIDRSLLFDLEADPDELRDLWGDPEHAATGERLEGLLRAQQATWGDILPWISTEQLPAFLDLSGQLRKPDRWQPRWIVEKYFR